MRIPFYFSIIISFLITTYTYSQIPNNLLVNWSKAKANIIHSSNLINVINIGAIGDGIFDNSTIINNQITSLNGTGAILFFPSGDYFMGSSLTLDDNIVIKGVSSDSSKFIFNLGSNQSHLFSAYGAKSNVYHSIQMGYHKFSDTLILNNATTNISNGDYIRIIEDDGNRITDSWSTNEIGQIIKVIDVINDTIVLEDKLRQTYTTSLNPRIHLLAPKKNIGIECIGIKRESNASSSSNIYFSYVANAWVIGVESDSCARSHIGIDHSTNIQIQKNYFHHAFEYGGGGKAYGIAIQRSSGNCLIENNIFEHLRHSMLVQAGANGNVFGYNYSFDPNWFVSGSPADRASDITIHGNYPYANLFEGNIAAHINVDGAHGMNGPENTFLRNRLTLYGIRITDSNSNYQNFIGNEMTNTNTLYGRYDILASNHYEYANNKQGIIIPASTINLTDTSYYLALQPKYWPSTNNWPSIGYPNFELGSIPSKNRLGFQNTICYTCFERTEIDTTIIFLDSIYLSGNYQTSTGSYYDSLININGCDSVIQTNLTISPNNSNIEENSNYFKLYPNPTHHFLTIKKNLALTHAMLKIYSTIGTLVYKENLHFENNDTSINLNKLPRGVYLIQIVSKKIIESHTIIIN